MRAKICHDFSLKAIRCHAIAGWNPHQSSGISQSLARLSCLFSIRFRKIASIRSGARPRKSIEANNNLNLHSNGVAFWVILDQPVKIAASAPTPDVGVWFEI
jgi:hypothetical protein